MTQHHFIQSVQGQKSIRETLSLVLFLVDGLNNATQNSKNFGTFKFIPEKQPKELKDLTQVSFTCRERSSCLIACSVSLQKDNLWDKDRHRLCLLSIHVIKLCNSSQQSRLACLFVHVLICIPPGRLRHFVQIVRNNKVKAASSVRRSRAASKDLKTF